MSIKMIKRVIHQTSENQQTNKNNCINQNGFVTSLHSFEKTFFSFVIHCTTIQICTSSTTINYLYLLNQAVQTRPCYTTSNAHALDHKIYITNFRVIFVLPIFLFCNLNLYYRFIHIQ